MKFKHVLLIEATKFKKKTITVKDYNGENDTSISAYTDGILAYGNYGKGTKVVIWQLSSGLWFGPFKSMKEANLMCEILSSAKDYAEWSDQKTFEKNHLKWYKIVGKIQASIHMLHSFEDWESFKKKEKIEI